MKFNIVPFAIALVIGLLILDGSFKNPTAIDYVIFALLAVTLILEFIVWKKKKS
jgi:hypothetical protein